MEKVLTRASDYDQERPALPWALAIAAWECRTVARWRERRREVQTHDLGERESPSSTEEQFIQEELHLAVSAALGELSDADRAALVAAYWEESRSGTPAARKRRQRALERLRVAFRRLYGSD
jgi:RNA polymerase sigma-70 factor (ECF subfamily)